MFRYALILSSLLLPQLTCLAERGHVISHEVSGHTSTIYEGGYLVEKVHGREECLQLPAGKLVEVEEAIKDGGFFEAKDSYVRPPETPFQKTHYLVHTIEVRLDGRSKRIQFDTWYYSSDLPEGIRTALQEISSVVRGASGGRCGFWPLIYLE